MKIAYKHIARHINPEPSLDDLSIKLFQLGHEHEVENNIFNFEFTPNRGDCLSIKGILRDLATFYEIDSDFRIYEKELKESTLNFENKYLPKIFLIFFNL